MVQLEPKLQIPFGMRIKVVIWSRVGLVAFPSLSHDIACHYNEFLNSSQRLIPLEVQSAGLCDMIPFGWFHCLKNLSDAIRYVSLTVVRTVF